MKLYDVYPLFDVEIVKGRGCYVYDSQGTEYLDLYGGHAVISVGHSHPHYVEALTRQAQQLVFYSNSVVNPLQRELAARLGAACGYDDYQLFLVNSGAEANENAMKLASFHTGKKRVVAFDKAFHGRTSLAVEATDNPKIKAPVNINGDVTFVPLNDIEAVAAEIDKGDVAAVIIEGIQGVGGINIPSDQFMRQLRELTARAGVVLIADEIQSGYGRTGKFFAHQWSGIKPTSGRVSSPTSSRWPREYAMATPWPASSLGLSSNPSTASWAPPSAATTWAVPEPLQCSRFLKKSTWSTMHASWESTCSSGSRPCLASRACAAAA